MKATRATISNMGLPEFNVDASSKKEEPIVELSIAQKKAILLHYTSVIAEVVKSDGHLSESTKMSRIKFLVAEIAHRVGSWMNFPNVDGIIEKVFGSAAGTLWAEFDRLSILEAREQEDLPPPLISDESAEFMDHLEETIETLKWNLNYQSMQSRVLVADLRKEIAVIAKLQETPKPVPPVRDEILCRYSILEEAIKRLTHSIEHAGQTCLPYIHELDRHLYWIALPTMDHVKETKMGYLVRIRDLLEALLEELKKNHPSLVQKISPATPSPIGLPYRCPDEPLGNYMNRLQKSHAEMTLEEKIVYLTKVMLNFPDANSSEAIRAAFMESVNRKVAIWHKFPTDNFLDFKSAVRTKCQELWH
jgi:hypothetical protein